MMNKIARVPSVDSCRGRAAHTHRCMRKLMNHKIFVSNLCLSDSLFFSFVNPASVVRRQRRKHATSFAYNVHTVLIAKIVTTNYCSCATHTHINLI